MSKKPIIAVDVDDVLAGVTEGMMHFVNAKFGTNHTMKDYEVVGPYWRYWEIVWGVDEEEGAKRYNAYIDADSHRTVAAIEGSIETIAWLKERYELMIITARELSYAENTHHWLEKTFPKTFKEVRFLPNQADGSKVPKAVIAQEIGARYLIDDNVEHCIHADKAGVTALLFGEYGWNKAEKFPPSITRVKDWHAVKEYFSAKL